MGVNKIISAFLTVAILGILIISGPANAFILGFSVLNPEVNKGEEISFSITIKNIEQENIDEIIFKIENKQCKFNIEGSIIDGCSGMQINRTGTDYGYGYGNIQNLTFSVKLDTINFSAGIYTTEIQVKSGNKTERQKGDDVTIKDSEIKSCSVRAKEGSLLVEGADFGNNNKINFYSPLKNAAKGEGYLTGQKDRTRFSYVFDVEKAYRTGSKVVFEVNGKYRIGIGKEKDANAKIIIENGKIGLISNSFSVENMNVYFIRGC